MYISASDLLHRHNNICKTVKNFVKGQKWQLKKYTVYIYIHIYSTINYLVKSNDCIFLDQACLR